MTYRQLAEALKTLTSEQLDSDVTVELSYEEECFPADLRICGDSHDSLDTGHPVIYC